MKKNKKDLKFDEISINNKKENDKKKKDKALNLGKKSKEKKLKIKEPLTSRCSRQDNDIFREENRNNDLNEKEDDIQENKNFVRRMPKRSCLNSNKNLNKLPLKELIDEYKHVINNTNNEKENTYDKSNNIEKNKEKDLSKKYNSSRVIISIEKNKQDKEKKDTPEPNKSKFMENKIEEEAKTIISSVVIKNYKKYTESCMEIILEILPQKDKLTRPAKKHFEEEYTEHHGKRTRKKIAVFDLDETLFHCSYKDINNFNLKVDVTMPSGNCMKFGVNLRPHWEDAIKKISKLYTIVTYTASHQSYADCILNYIDPKKLYFKNRLYRNNCINVNHNGTTIYIKDMTIFDNFELKDVVIVDNSVLSFAFNLDNGIPIIPYYEGESDNELSLLAHYLIKLFDNDNIAEVNGKNINLNKYLERAKKNLEEGSEEESEEESDEEDEDNIDENVVIINDKNESNTFTDENHKDNEDDIIIFREANDDEDEDRMMRNKNENIRQRGRRCKYSIKPKKDKKIEIYNLFKNYK